MAVGSTVSTSGHHSPAGIGVGHILGSAQVQEITAVSCTVNGELRNFDNKTETVISQKKAPLWEIAATSSPGEIAATSSPAITISVLVVAGVAFLCIVYLTYQWFAGYSEGLRGKKLALRPLTRLRSLTTGSVSQSEPRHQPVPTEEADGAHHRSPS